MPASECSKHSPQRNRSQTVERANPPPASPGNEASSYTPPNEKPAQRETKSIENEETSSEDQEPTQQEMKSDQTTTSTTPVMDQPLPTRPRKDRRSPAYLQEYVLT
ncbi:hypothetical protein OS493_026964 [Desmophyllum pertusum]|uniref:Uncharacterized protein n=1 Tax=Desmophyllum pertusum TaxID=174260 RepID=A0A9W9Z141_9CNID|nr:hypothetical protein OS493_026964 [Desmophyllum pertusum]